MKRLMILLILVLMIAPLRADNLNDFLVSRSQARATQVADQSQTATKQADTSASGSTASLLDESSAADLFTAAFQVAGIGKGASSSPVSAGATAFSIFALMRNTDPLEPSFYNSNRRLRNISFAIATRKDDGSTDDTKIYQLKVKLIDQRDPNEKSNQVLVKKLLDEQIQRHISLVDAQAEVRKFIFSMPPDRLSEIFGISSGDMRIFNKLVLSEGNNLSAPRGITGDERLVLNLFIQRIMNADVDWSKRLTPAELSRVDELLLPGQQALQDLEGAAKAFIDAVRSKKQVSLSFSAETPSVGHDKYIGEFIYDQGIDNTSMYLTANAAAELSRNAMGRGDYTYRAALRGRWEINIATVGKRGSYFDLTGEAKSHTGDKSTFKTQGKITIPITGGVDLPISVTWANRTDLIKESKVTGHIGFTFDYSKLLELIKIK